MQCLGGNVRRAPGSRPRPKSMHLPQVPGRPGGRGGGASTHLCTSWSQLGLGRDNIGPGRRTGYARATGLKEVWLRWARPNRKAPVPDQQQCSRQRRCPRHTCPCHPAHAGDHDPVVCRLHTSYACRVQVQGAGTLVGNSTAPTVLPWQSEQPTPAAGACTGRRLAVPSIMCGHAHSSGDDPRPTAAAHGQAQPNPVQGVTVTATATARDVLEPRCLLFLSTATGR